VSGNTALQLACARAYAEKWHPPIVRVPLNSARSRHARLRVAYVSADFTEHAVSYLLAGVFEAHDRSQFEIIALRLKPSDGSAMAQRVDKAFERTIDVSGMTDAEAAAKMVELEVDIAVDLTGFTENSRTSIFASHPAPIQINYLGYPGTMGTPYMDFILADEYVIPREAAAQYSEKVAYLPDCFQANDDKRAITQPVPSRTEAGLPPTGFIFCAFNSFAKLNPPLFDIWMRLLAAVPDSVLWLIASEPTARRNLIAQAEQRGIAAHRLVFAPHVRYPDHLARMGLADLFLDTLPFNAGTTASDALWAGLPVLTCSGEAFAARMAGSLLRAVGLEELIARDLQHYEALALQLATRPEELARVRARLAANRASAALFDTKRFCRNLEMAYREMWSQYERGEAPATFRV
jgi:predicted O-linked N-acetylglucosamine transferase (SPINDLY family)